MAASKAHTATKQSNYTDMEKEDLLDRKIMAELLIQMRDQLNRLYEKLETMEYKQVKEWYSVVEFSANTGISAETIRKRCQRGFYKVQEREVAGGKYYIHCSDLIKHNHE